MTNAHEGPHYPQPGAGDTGKRIAAVALIGGLVALALATVFLLPPDRARPPEPSATAPSQVPPAPVAPSGNAPPIAATDADKRKAEDMLSEAHRRLDHLESQGVRVWGGESMSTSLPAAEDALKKAHALFNQARNAEAIARFQDAIALFDQLEESRPERFHVAMERGALAYEERDGARAVRHYKLALAINPGHAEATARLARANNLPRVLAHLAKGMAFEEEGDIDKAQTSYAAAASLDVAYLPTRDALERVETAIAERNFRNALSDALVRLDKRDFTGAAAALKSARTIRPDSTEVKVAARRLATAVRAATLDRLRRAALRREKSEQWTGALALYNEALAIDTNAAFAVIGQTRARAMANLYAGIDRYLKAPARLQSPEPLDEAKVLIARTASANGGGPILVAKRKKLAELVSRAETPVTVILRSDAKTQVTVYRVGRFGVFESYKIELKPGKYVAVGARPGYRDIRVTFEVAPGIHQLAVTVQCTERISP